MNASGIAIVGAACRYPDARTPAELWENVLAQRRAFRRIPRERLPFEDYGSTDHATPDATYGAHAAVLEGYRFDRERFRVSAATFKSVDLAHWLALEVAADALTDAGYPSDFVPSRDSTAVLVGNTLTGEFSRASMLRLRWPYVRRVLDGVLEAAGESRERRGDLLPLVERAFKAPFPPVDGETLAGSLSNTIAGRICNYFDFHGGGYTVDGACASSLLAVAHACSALTAGDIDVALAGGVDLSLDPFELVGFAKAGALARDDMRVYDSAPTGFWPGEGCGFVVLMRDADAIAQARRIYAVIRGWGISSDGSGGMTRPDLEGQMLALTRAYARAGFGPDSVGYFEGHGTGTAVGDATELAALSAARRSASLAAPPAAIGSIKANIGHTKAASGIAGLLKATFALRHRILPPISGCANPHPTLAAPDAALTLVDRPRAWPASVPRRAGVSAMGFGGINVHLALEGAESTAEPPHVVEACARAWQDAELFLFSAPTAQELITQIESTATIAPVISLAELTDLAVRLQRRAHTAPARAAVVASTPAELLAGLQSVRTAIAAGMARIDVRAGVFVSIGHERPRIGLLFSGQAAPVRTAGGSWSRRFADVERLYELAALPSTAADPADTTIAQPAIVTASLAAVRCLSALGIAGDVAVGHSMGELSALRWAGVLPDDESTIRLARTRGRLMAQRATGPGTMAALTATSDEANVLIAGTDAVIAGFNSPRQVTVSGRPGSIDAVLARAAERGIAATRLPVSYAFHSPLMVTVQPAWRNALATCAVNAPRANVVSTITGRSIGDGDDIRALLENQLCAPVRFTQALAAAGPVDLFIEAGPGHTLAALAAAQTRIASVSVDAASESLRPLLVAVGAAFALGAPVAATGLAEDRFARPFNPERRLEFLANPCESALDARCPAVPATLAADFTEPARAVTADSTQDDTCTLLRALVAARTDLPLHLIPPEARFLSDLHLNSITVSEVLADAARHLGAAALSAPTEYANTSLAEAARALDQLKASPAPALRDGYPGVDSWVLPFVVTEKEERRPRAATSTRRGPWRIAAPPEHPLREQLQALFAGEEYGPGTVVCIDSAPSSTIALLLDEAKLALRDGRPARFIVVQERASVGGFARTLFLESGVLDVAIVTLDFSHPASAERIRAEACAASGFVDVRYDDRGRRLAPAASVIRPDQRRADPPLGPDDVLLVTGGGKGIAAECALAVAREWHPRVAIVGRSRPDADPVLRANLDRIRQAGIACTYVVADVGDARAVRNAVDAVRSEYGAVTAVLHAAGVNEPALIPVLTDEMIASALGPKIDGARNVLAACDRSRLRLLVTFGSIIARTGLPGEAHYALANERLREWTIRTGSELPDCRVLALEWSVWSATGMGERLGRVDALVRRGVTPISIEDGVALFLKLLRAQLPAPAIIATGRFGEPATLQLGGREVPFLRFLESVRVHYPEVEVVADATLSLKDDPYLADHRLDGELLFPAVIGLEAMTQATRSLRESSFPVVFENVEFARPIVAPVDGPLVVRALALAQPDGRVRVHLRTDRTGFSIDHFRATCRWDATDVERFGALQSANRPSDDFAIEAVPDLYGSLLFQSGRFARVRRYRRLFATECVAEIAPGGAEWFGAYLPDTLVLGDPGARDAALHSVQASIPQRRVVPVSVERLVIRRPLQAPCSVHAHQRSQSGDTFTWDLEIADRDGEPIELWTGLQLRAIASLPVRHAPAPLLGPYVERQLASLGHPVPPRVLFVTRKVTGRNGRRAAPVLAALLPGARVAVRSDGKPETAGGGVSAAHAGVLTLAVSAPTLAGCDVERVTGRSARVWRDLLGGDRATLAEVVARECDESYAAAATRVWTALESLKKAGATLTSPLTLERAHADGWVTLRAGRYAVSTWITEMADESPIALAVATGETDAAV